jgi:hypothetical protein
MSTLFADAFFFVALLNPRDRAHSLANAYIEPDLELPLLATTDALTGDHHFEQAGFRALLRQV